MRNWDCGSSTQKEPLEGRRDKRLGDVDKVTFISEEPGLKILAMYLLQHLSGRWEVSWTWLGPQEAPASATCLPHLPPCSGRM